MPDKQKERCNVLLELNESIGTVNHTIDFGMMSLSMSVMVLSSFAISLFSTYHNEKIGT